MDDLNKAIDNFYESYKGAEDLRTLEQKMKDFNQNEFVTSANEVEWKEKNENSWRSFPTLQQFYTLKCVAFTTAKLALINFWLKTKEFLLFSPNSIYKYRSNQNSGGMMGDEAFQIWKDRGISLDATAKSNQTQEGDPYEVSLFATEVAKGFKLGNWITINEKDFDRVCSTIQTTGKGVMVWFYFTSREWSPEFPKVMDNLEHPYVADASRHSVTAVDFGLINGKEYIKVEDSAKFGGRNIRYISREFFTARNFLAKYPMNFNYEEVPPVVVPPVVTPKLTKLLKFGMQDPEVKILQDILKVKGFFPVNISTTINFGNVTKTSVIAFQKAKGLTADGIVGQKTRDLLNS